MAIQLPALEVRDPNIFGRFAQGQQVANQNRLLDMNAQNQEFQQNRLTANDQFQREQYTDQQEQIMRQAEGMYFGRVGDMLAEYPGQPEIQRQIWKGARAKGEEIGIRDIHEMDDIDPTLPESIQMIRGQAAAYGYNPGANQTAEQRDFASMTKNLTPEEVEQARRVKLGLAPRAATSADERIAMSDETTSRVATSKATIKGAEKAAETGAKLDVELQKAPQVAAAIKQAEAQAAAFVNEGQKQKKDTAAYNVYQAGMGGLIAGLGGTETGPIAGRLPAVTTNQQIAEGAVAAMAPILKSMFRVAGEGTFTDKDQELLLNMVPTRKDTPEAITAKISNIDAIVNAKLGQANSQPRDNQPQPQAGTGNKRPDDEIRQLEQELGL